MTPQMLHGVVAQRIGHSPPTERDAYIHQGKPRGAEPALVVVIADAQVELPNALLVQRRHRSLYDKQTRRTA
jgi:hypothetical protein